MVFHRVPYSVVVSLTLRVVVDVTVYGLQVPGGGGRYSGGAGLVVAGDVGYDEAAAAIESVGTVSYAEGSYSGDDVGPASYAAELYAVSFAAATAPARASKVQRPRIMGARECYAG